MKAFFFLTILLIISCNQKEQEEKLIVKSPEEIQSETFNREIAEAQEEIDKIIPEDSIYSFVNTALSSNNIFNYCDCLNVLSNWFVDISGDLYFVDQLSKEIDIEKERNFITKQYVASLKFEWKENLIKDKRIIRIPDEINSSQEPISELFKLMEVQDCCFTTVSKPIFFQNFQYAVVEVSYYCGVECAERANYIYEREEKGYWKLIKEYNRIFA